MSEKLHYRKLEKMYHDHPLNAFFRAKIIINQGKAELVIPIRKSFWHAAQAVHGSVYFKALDDTAYFSANSVVRDVFLLTVSFTIYLMRPVSTGEMKAVGRLVNSTRTQFIAESTLYNSENEELARGSGLYVRSKIKLTKELGYK
ncbi:MAG: PaaI family thioesterase [Candidatus Heimdallarchaeota archaeon]